MFVIEKRREQPVINALGAGYAYPAKGWETYAMRENNTRYLLTRFIAKHVLVGIELLLAKKRTAFRNSGRAISVNFASYPVKLRSAATSRKLDERFVAVFEGPDAHSYTRAFEVRYRGGVAYVQSDGGLIQRMVLYGVDSKEHAT